MCAGQSQGLVAAEVLRNFMRSFAAKHSSEQAMLFILANLLLRKTGALIDFPAVRSTAAALA